MSERFSEPPGDATAGKTTRKATCPCGTPIDPLRARFVAVHDGRVVSFCSPACRDQGAAPRQPTEELPAAERRRPTRQWRFLAAATPFILGGGVLLGVRVSFDGRTATAALNAHDSQAAQGDRAAPPQPPVEDPMYGPELPPADVWIENDRWYHPLPGPLRRLPERSSRRFGVDRDHDSPESCGNGHCGVDIGEIKGEPVVAVHDGVVERVVREPRASDRGGRYVRLIHYGGRIVTQYMHLDEIPPELKPGYHVRAGEKIGTVGDTGTHNSGPHLHFTFATRAAEDAPEVYVDPLALLTVWPLYQR